MRYFIRFCYDGSKFYGFQRLSVQKCLEDALFSFSKKVLLLKVLVGLIGVFMLMDNVLILI